MATQGELDLTAAAFKRYRALARRRWNRKDYAGVLEACVRWDRWMDDHPDMPMPDAWRDIERYREEAEYLLRWR